MSTTQLGLAAPSMVTLTRTTAWVPPPTWSTDTTSAVPRTTEPTGTGDGNRTLSTPTLTPIDVPVTSNILGIRSLTSDRVR